MIKKAELSKQEFNSLASSVAKNVDMQQLKECGELDYAFAFENTINSLVEDAEEEITDIEAFECTKQHIHDYDCCSDTLEYLYEVIEKTADELGYKVNITNGFVDEIIKTMGFDDVADFVCDNADVYSDILDDANSEIRERLEDEREYRNDPYGYNGVSQNDFL